MCINHRKTSKISKYNSLRSSPGISSGVLLKFLQELAGNSFRSCLNSSRSSPWNCCRSSPWNSSRSSPRSSLRSYPRNCSESSSRDSSRSFPIIPPVVPGEFFQKISDKSSRSSPRILLGVSKEFLQDFYAIPPRVLWNSSKSPMEFLQDFSWSSSRISPGVHPRFLLEFLQDFP